MNNEIDLKEYSIRTDLIIEKIKNTKDFNSTIRNYGDIQVEEVILNDQNKVLNKSKGNYITISFDDVTDTNNLNNVTDVFSNELKEILKKNNLNKNMKCLVIGLGNDKSTPDSLGVKAIEKIIVTKHLFDLSLNVSKEYSNVSIFSPGVMGGTGLETSSVIKGIVNETKPDYIIIIDALCASNIDRVNKTIQITDTGISPGSGIGNNRGEISKNTINIPVIAIGVPTVVDSVVLVSDTINYLFKKFNYSIINQNNEADKLKTSINYLKNNFQKELSNEDKKNLLGIIGNLSEKEIKTLIFEVLSPIGYNMIVTPKEVDFIIEKLSLAISRGINNTLHGVPN